MWCSNVISLSESDLNQRWSQHHSLSTKSSLILRCPIARPRCLAWTTAAYGSTFSVPKTLSMPRSQYQGGHPPCSLRCDPVVCSLQPAHKRGSMPRPSKFCPCVAALVPLCTWLSGPPAVALGHRVLPGVSHHCLALSPPLAMPEWTAPSLRAVRLPQYFRMWQAAQSWMMMRKSFPKVS